MTDEIEHRLATAAGAFREHEVVQERCAELRDRAELLTVRIEGLRERYARERAEAEAVHYRLAELEARHDAVQREYDAAQARLTELAAAPGRYASLLEEKERYLSGCGDPRGWQLLTLAHEEGRLSGELRELAEAVHVAGRAWDALSDVQNKLRSADSWTGRDVRGGGVITDAVEYTRMVDAARAAAVADRRLVVLRTELADFSGDVWSTPTVAVDGLTRFTDIWMDAIAADPAVRDRIAETREQVGRALDRIRELDGRLRQRETRTRERLARIATQRHSLLTGHDPTVAGAGRRLEQFRT